MRQSTPSQSTPSPSTPAQSTPSQSTTSHSTRAARIAPRRVVSVVRSLLVRLAATVALLLVILGIPLAAVALTGRALPDLDRLRTSWRTGIVDDHVLLGIGALLFVVLWAWFSIAAIAEVVRVTRWRVHGRSGRRSVLGSPVSTPTGWVRRLVRVALLSTTVMASTGVSPPMGFALSPASMQGPAVPAPIATPTAEGFAAPQASIETARTLVSSGRETPYSVASRAGDPSLRDQIIERHRGRRAPDGTVWMGGVFPAGMEVEIPAPVTHVVERGESYWSIAEDQLELGRPEAAPSEIANLTNELVATNAGTFHRSDRTLLLPGDVLTFPPLDAPVTVVVAGNEPPPPVSPAADVPSADRPAPPAAAAPAAAETDAAAQQTTVASTPSMSVDRAAGVPGSPAILPVAAQVVAQAPIHDGPAVSMTSIESSSPVAVPSIRNAPGRPMTTTVGGTVLLAAGALGLLESRRRHQLRHSVGGAAPEPPTPADAATERALRSLDADERTARLDIALRSIGHLLADSPRHVVALRTAADGRTTVLLDGPAPSPTTPWQPAIEPSAWILPAAIPTTDLAPTARRAGQPCPALVHLGTSSGEDVFVDLEAIGLLRVDGPTAEVAAVTRAIAASLAASPLSETVRLVTHGIEVEAHLGNLNAEAADGLDAALDVAVTGLASTALTTSGQRTFHLRSRTSDATGETWEPAIVVSTGIGAISGDVADDIRTLTRRGGRGLGLVIGTTAGDDHAAIDGATWVLRATGPVWTLDPLGVDIVPAGLSPLALDDLSHLLDAAERPTARPFTDDGQLPRRTDRSAPSVDESQPFVESEWSLMVRVLGRVEIVDREGNALAFDRGKSLELLAWLSQHPERPTRSGARTALWDVDVRDATFANVVSDARRTMARAVAPPDGEEWIHRTLTDHLPMHTLVTSDAALLRSRLRAASGREPSAAIEILRPGLELVEDLPFAGTSYLWPDAEGITSSLILLTTGAAAELARHHLALGDIDGVFWATGQGLKVLSGHEELIGLRMRAHAHAGDLAGVRCEWDVYRRALDSDAWSGAEPSPKLVAIHRELLATR